MNKLNNNLSEIFDIEPIRRTEIVESPIKTDLEIADEINADSALARKNIKSLLGKGEIAVDNLILVAQESEHPRASEVLGNFIKTLSDLNKDFLDIQKKKQELKPQDIKQSINVEKAVFVGSTAELLKQIRENR
jgi:predicted transcriptional regulator